MLKTSAILVVLLSATAAAAEQQRMPENAQFCPSWAEAHERSLASLNHGRPPYAVRWQGCITIKKGEPVDLVETYEGYTEIIYHGRHWFLDGGPF
jgi:hypothetical protein